MHSRRTHKDFREKRKIRITATAGKTYMCCWQPYCEMKAFCATPRNQQTEDCMQHWDRPMRAALRISF